MKISNQQNVDNLDRLINDTPSIPSETPEEITKSEKCKSNFPKYVYNHLFENGNGNWKVWNESFYRYTNKGYWEKLEVAEVKQLILDFAEKSLNNQYESIRHCNDTYDFCKLKLRVSKQQDSDTRLKCFKNGTLDVSTMQLLPHSKEHYLTYHLDADYVSNCSCPEVIRNFLVCSYGVDMIEPIQAYTSMLLDPEAPSGYFIHLIGGSGTGKGTLSRLWQSMFSTDAVLSDNKAFDIVDNPDKRHQYLSNKAIVLMPDVQSDLSRKDLGTFYELIDNGLVSARALYSNSSYTHKWNLRFVMASVDPLRVTNSSAGWDRRCILLLTLSLSGDADPDLEARLQAVKGEFISWALSISKERRNQIIVKGNDSERIKEMKQTISIQSDPVTAFVDSCLRPLDSEQAYLTNTELHSFYQAFCRVNGYKPLATNAFVPQIRRILPDHSLERTRCRTEIGGWKSARFTNLCCLPEAFTKDNDNVVCNKHSCVEGGLEAFKEHKRKDNFSSVVNLMGYPEITQDENDEIVQTSEYAEIAS